MNLCRDCKWSRATWWERLASVYKLSRCCHYQSMTPASVDPVTGDKIMAGYSYCDTMRMHTGRCGHDGKLFEQKEKVK